MRVRAAVLRAAGAPLSIEALDLEAPRPDEVLVRLVACGVCHTDLRARAEPGLVPLPVVLGHEGAGVVEEIGAEVRGLRRGDAVLLTFDSCGACPSCALPAPAYCHELLPRNFGGRRPDGSTPLRDAAGAPVGGRFFGQSAFATHAMCTERNAIRCPPGLPLQVLAPLGCGFQTGAGAVLRSLRVPAGASFVVFGAGSVGLSAIMAARLAGAAPIIAVDVAPARLDAARRLGASHVLEAGRVDIPGAILEITGSGAHYALDASGAASAIESAVACLAPLGVCGVAASTAEPHVRFNARHLLAGGRTIRGISEGDSVPAELIPALAEHFRAGRLPFGELVTEYPFERIEEALQDAAAGAVVKPVLRFN